MARKEGTISNDTLTGGAGADELFGLAGKDLLIGKGGNDSLDGGAGNDFLDGGAGNDYLDGRAGDDDLRGGAGNDIYIVDNAGDITKSLADAGADAVGALLSYVLGPNQEHLTLLGKAALKGTGNAGNNQLNGNEGANILSGLAGIDVLDGRKGIDDLRGGKGDDRYVIDNAREINKTLGDDGRDQVQSIVSYTLGSFQEELILLGAAALTGIGNEGGNFLRGNDAANVLRGKGGIDVLEGGKGDDQLFGDGGRDGIFGEAGADVLRGGDGDDGLDGGTGNDQLFGDAGNDRLFGRHNADRLDGGAGDDFLSGGNGTDVLVGGDGDDYLRGDEGIDVLWGGNGNDTYEIDTNAEVVKTELDPGFDRVLASFDYNLGEHQEHLTFYGTRTGHVGMGNAKDNTIVGTDAVVDELRGLAGDDTLDGGAGDDHLVGGDGNDTYYIDHAGDIHDADTDDGVDRVNSTITYTLLAHQEELVLRPSSTPISGTGNVKANFMIGNAGANVLDGGQGADEIIGGGGADTLLGDAGNDTLHYELSAIRIDGGAGNADTLFLTGEGDSISLDLTAVANDILVGIENIRFAPNSYAPDEAHTLKLTASDVLALSNVSDTLLVQGEADDTVQMTGGGWSQSNSGPVLLADGQLYQSYSNGAAFTLVDTDIQVQLT